MRVAVLFLMTRMTIDSVCCLVFSSLSRCGCLPLIARFCLLLFSPWLVSQILFCPVPLLASNNRTYALFTFPSLVPPPSNLLKDNLHLHLTPISTCIIRTALCFTFSSYMLSVVLTQTPYFRYHSFPLFYLPCLAVLPTLISFFSLFTWL